MILMSLNLCQFLFVVTPGNDSRQTGDKRAQANGEDTAEANQAELDGPASAGKRVSPIRSRKEERARMKAPSLLLRPLSSSTQSPLTSIPI